MILSRTLEEKLGEGRAAIDDPETLVSDFIEFVRGEAPGEIDTQLVVLKSPEVMRLDQLVPEPLKQIRWQC